MREVYETPLVTRYASKEMAQIFSDDEKFKTWRKLWVALAKSEKELGLNITNEQIEEMEKNIENINYEDAERFEKEFRHDVMAHIHAYGLLCPKAKPIIHLGATSAFVDDNTDIILMDRGLQLIEKKLLKAIKVLSEFALKYKDLPTLGYTHFQPAQLTTVGKRACLWIQDLILDLQDLRYRRQNMMLRGVKGTTGTQASFMELFDGDEEKVKELDRLVVEKMGYKKSFPVTGQTYTRKYDFMILSVLSGIAQSAHKFSNDIRLLQHLREIEEPFEEKQIGSSAMAYKRNPMRSERMAALSRYVIVTLLNSSITASNQWFERTLDDSANRRIVIPEMFLATDAILNLYINIASGLKVNEKVIEKNVKRELPFMATEKILMAAVKKGGDRQELHEAIRVYSLKAAEEVKNGEDNRLLEYIKQDKRFGLSHEEILDLTDPRKFTGRSANQVKEFIEDHVRPLLDGIEDIEVKVEV
ncbi:adenylosuccinate lyase [Caldanaerobacter subterraneus subsp. tengcongensis MB4]|uniref:Adenylosuccinate lyase n=2 Tax=Caldanaerobacter subterraneus TaxID=911092 RepID=Q8RA62_CALS4|nr:adenylosuccinate lyase [Caldanaerobacter subterraneus]AAM24589.1 Adenylosuccinate lyase [Caldanaerobacter subterraneus subsp. tengcongensis MB4]ERM92354.1 adenylosuccinate lyase [Caldanaerobacter subterraneus subsp. yonseiensis KB-1]MCS3915848.1 adenylosuccinate lyase [Caldanaerobacter subterraneus subsp. tengcongensis MB4]